jgi:DNA-binding NarL/FixJ family response regulator
MPQSILLADDHLMFRQGIRALLETEGREVVAEAKNGREAVRLARKLGPDVVVMDIGMPLLNGIDAACEIQRRAPDVKIIMLTMYAEESYVLEALQAGARGYVLKLQAADDLITALQQVEEGGVYLSPGVSNTLLEAYRDNTKVNSDSLTLRERQVLQLVAEGNTTREIANILSVSVKTADSHRTRLMKKLDIHETAGLVRYAIRRGLIHV